jgi:hypothetical protein
MPQIDRASARALVDAGYMPLSHYIEMFGPELMLRKVASPTTVPETRREKIQRLFVSTTFSFR